MVPHQNTVRSKSFGSRSIPLARAVVATLVLIATTVIGISSSALAHEVGDSATVSHTCRHTDGCDSAGSLMFHECRHADGCSAAGSAAGSLGFHECHTDGCHSDGQLHSSPRHQCDDAAAAAGVLRSAERFHPHHGDCHEHAQGPVS